MKSSISVYYKMAACRTIFNRLTSYISNPIILQTSKYLPSYEQCATLKLKYFPKHGLPLPPKRPKGAFFKFSETVFPEIKKENPQMLVAEIMKIVAIRWAEFPQEKKDKMLKEAQEDAKIFRQDYENYKLNLTPEDIEKINKARDEEKLAKRTLALKKKAKELEKPKRPLSPYVSFYRDTYAQMPQTESHLDIMKKLAVKWRTEDFDVRKKYRTVYEQEMAEYRLKLSEWEEKMINLGHLDVLGTKTLRKLHKQYKKA